MMQQVTGILFQISWKLCEKILQKLADLQDSYLLKIDKKSTDVN